MDVMKLDRNTYQPVSPLIEGYSSMIWSERYIEPGEFELKTPLVDKTKLLIPPGSLISVRESKEVMMVANHTIGKDSGGNAELTVKGFSLTAFTKHRYLEGPYPKKKYPMARKYTYSECVSVLLWNAFVNPTVNDVTRIGEGGREVRDSIPNVMVSNSTTVGGTQSRRWLEGGQLYDQIYLKLKAQKLGIRTIRPNSVALREVLVTTDDKGKISYNINAATSRLRFDVYNGTNRSRFQTAVTPVVFYHQGGYFDSPSYLWDIDNYETIIVAVSGVGTRRFFRNRDTDAGLSGLDRRALWIDGGDPQLVDLPERPDDGTAAQIAKWREDRADAVAKNKATRLEFVEDLTEVADAQLEEKDQVALFEAKISAGAPYKYGVDYFLGDQVTLLGEYGFDQTMIVVEYVRTDDANGDVGYPSLAVQL